MKLALLSLVFLLGCASRHTRRASVLIDPSCLTKPVRIENCDLSRETPTCSGKIAVDYRKGCEKVEILSGK